MTGKLTIQCRLLRQAELEQGVAILKSAYDWLRDQGIRQWTLKLYGDIGLFDMVLMRRGWATADVCPDGTVTFQLSRIRN